MGNITAFISYSHDSDEHREQVLALSERLRADGIETRLDQYLNGSPQNGWPRWMLDQLDAAAFVLVVCTQTYYRRFRGHEEPGKGKGVDWEGALITQELYDSRSSTLKFIPVFLSAAVENCIPEPLRAGTHYALTSENAYQSLYDCLLGQAGVEAGSLGVLKTKPRPKGTALTFGEASPPEAAKRDISRITHAAEKLIGRETELKQLDEAWSDSAQHVLVIRGIGGEGKTSLIVEWTHQLARRDYDGASYFDWSFYSQGTRDQTTASSDSFIAAALGFFGGEAGKQLANSAASARDKAAKLLEYVRKHRTLLVLDGLEPLQHPPGPLAGRLRDDAMAVLLKGLAQSNPGLCVVTTREPVTDLASFQDSTAPEWELEHLSETAGADLLQRLLEPQKPKNVHQVRSTTEERMEISRAVKGHALTLRLLGGFIHRALRDVRRWREVDYAKADAQFKTNPKDPDARYGHAFKTIEAYEHWLASGGPATVRQRAVLRLLGLFDRPASGASLAALRAQPVIANLTEPLCGITDDEWNTTLSELEECGLVAHPKTAPLFPSSLVPSLDAHPLLREYFARQLRTQHPDAWRAAHRRLFEHLCATPDKPQPTLEDLQPLYQAVVHGCQAGMQQEACDEVYFARIQRRNENYSIKKLGAFGADLGAVACFFEQPWSHVLPMLTEAAQAWMLSEAAVRLRALGRLTEAIEPMRAGLENYLKQEHWGNAARLAGMELTLGEVAGAVRDAEQSVTYADRSGDAFQRMALRTSHADALHQAGHRAEAEARFREAEEMQAEREPGYPMLYSMGGFQYCDLLLAAPERAAWQCLLGNAGLQPAVSSIVPETPRRAVTDKTLSSHGDATSGAAQQARHSGQDVRASRIQSCRAVSERAAKMFEWRVPGDSLLDIALDHLTLGRAALYEAILEGSSLDPCHASLQHAVDGLRRSGYMDHLPCGLLTRAWLRSLTGARTGPESAQSDLDEAWEIAERDPMPLFLADIHLHRARLFGRLKPEASGEKYPWESPAADLAAARRLIDKHGYERRREELEDAEAAAKNWPETIEPRVASTTKKMKIPNSVIYVVGDVLGSWYYSHTKLNTLFGGAGFPCAPTDGNCIQKCQEWLRRANDSSDIDPLELLGCVLVEFMNLDRHDEQPWQEGCRRVTEVLAKNGYAFELNGNIAPMPSRIAAEPTSSAQKVTQIVPTNPPPVQLMNPLTPSMSTQPMKTTVLFLAANPDGVTRLALDKECRAIREKIRASDFPKALELRNEWAVRPHDLLQYLNEYRPHVVHFSGHGSASEELILHDEHDQAKPVSLAALRALFTTLKDNIRLLMLNACYSRPQAEAIVEIIDCAVGMNKAIGDQAAIVFAASFYGALGFGRSVKEAFDQGCTALLLEGILEENTPELLVKKGVDASSVFLIGPAVNPK